MGAPAASPQATAARALQALAQDLDRAQQGATGSKSRWVEVLVHRGRRWYKVVAGMCVGQGRTQDLDRAQKGAAGHSRAQQGATGSKSRWGLVLLSSWVQAHVGRNAC